MTRTRSAQWMRQHVVVLLLAGVGIFFLAGVAAAYWSIGVTSPQGSAMGARLTTPSSPSASVNANGSVKVTWTVPGGELAGASYSVTRTGGTEGSTLICANTAGTTCTDSGPLTPAVLYTYSIVATLGTNWVSTAATATATAETPSFTISLSASPYTAGTPITVSSVKAQVGGVTDVTYGASTGTVKTITWSGLANSPSGHAPSYPSGSVTFTNGVASPGTSFTAYDAGSNTLMATDANTSAVSGSVTVTVTPKAADSGGSFTLAGTTSETAGSSDNLTITALDAYGNTDTNYTGSHNLTFSGANLSPNNTHPTVTNSSATAINFGSTTATTFAGGVASPSTTGATGQAVMVLYKVETANVTASDGTISNPTALSVTVTPKAADSGGSFSLAGTTSETAGSSDNLTITALDAYGNTDTNYTGSHNLTFSGANLSPNNTHPTVTNSSATAINFGSTTAITFAGGVASPSTTGATGQAVMVLYKVETANVTASDGTISNPTALSVTVTPKAADSGGKFTLAGSSSQVAGSSDNLTITALDAYGNTDTNYTGSHNLTFSGANLSPNNTHPTVTNSSATAINFGSTTATTFAGGVASPSTTGATGQAVMVLYKVETANVTASDGTISNPTALSVTVTPKAADSGGSFSLAGTTSETAGSSDNLTITALDAYGNTDTNYTGSHNLTFSGANLSPNNTHPTVTNSSATAINFGSTTATTFAGGVASPSTTGATGQAVMVLYKVETANVTASDGTISNPTALSVTVTPKAADSGGKFTLAGSSSQVAGSSDNLTITALDAYGNTDTNYTGSHNLTFSGANLSPNNTHPTVTNSSATAINFGSTTATTFAGGVASPSTTGATGQAVMVLYKVETANVTASDGTISNPTALSVTVTPKAADSGGKFTLAGSSSQVAGSSDNLTITALDAYGNTDTNYTGSHNLTFSGANLSPNNTHPTVTNSSATAINFGSTTATTFAGGVASPSTTGATGQAVMVLYKVETANVTASDGTISNPTALSVTVTPKAADSGGKFTLAGSSSQVAGSSDNLTITALDAYGNTDTNYTGSHNLTFSGANLSPNNTHPTVTNSSATAINFGSTTATTFAGGVASPSTTGATGQAVMVLYKVETANVTASDGTISNPTALSVTVTPKAADSGGSFSLAGSSSQVAGSSDNLTITALDAYGNTDTNYTGSHNLTFSGANLSPNNTHPTVTNSSATAINLGSTTATTFAGGVASPSTTGATGQAVMVLYKVETANVTASDGTISNPTALSVTVTPKAADSGGSFSLAGTTSETAGSSDNLTITALDAYGNTDTNYTGSHNLTFSGANLSPNNTHPTVTNSSATAINFGSTTATTFAGGVASPSTTGATGQAVMVLYKVETANVTASDGTISNPTALSVTVTPKAADSGGSFSLAGTTSETAGSSDNLTITALDAYGNTDTNYTGSHNLTFSGANLSPNNTHPTVTNSSATAINFGSTTATTFAGGVASPSTTGATGQAVMVLYKVETANVTASDGTISNPTALSVTVTPASASKVAFTTSVVSGSTSSTANLGPVTVEEQDSYNNPVQVSSTTTVTLSKTSGTGTVTFATTQFGSSVTSVTIAANTTTTSFFVGDTTVESPTIQAAISGMSSASQTETTTTAPAGLTLTSISQSGGTTITCSAPSGDATTCTGSIPNGNGTFSAKVEFVNSAGTTGVVYSTTQSSSVSGSITKGSLTTLPVAISQGQTTSSVSITGNTAGSSGVVGTLTFGPYTINVNIS